MSDKVAMSAQTIKLSKLDALYLTNTRFLPEDLMQMLSAAKVVDDDARVLSLDRETAERFRDEFTTRLAKAGFGPDYEPTREGKVLEELIDLFGK